MAHFHPHAKENRRMTTSTQPRVERRKTYRVPIAREDQVIGTACWPAHDVAAVTSGPEENRPIQPLNLSLGGMAFTHLTSPAQREPQENDVIGLVLRRGPHHLILSASVKHTKNIGPFEFRTGVGFIFDDRSAVDRRNQRVIEALIADVQRDKCKRRAIYGKVDVWKQPPPVK
jgi:hypothetical protein